MINNVNLQTHVNNQIHVIYVIACKSKCITYPRLREDLQAVYSLMASYGSQEGFFELRVSQEFPLSAGLGLRRFMRGGTEQNLGFLALITEANCNKRKKWETS